VCYYFYRTPGIDVRFGLTDEIVQSVLPQRTREDGGHDHSSVKAWKKAVGRYSELLGARRRIAHHPSTIRIGGLNLDTQLDGMSLSWFEIYVGDNERLRKKEANIQALKIADLKAHLRAVMALRDRLYRFYCDVLTKPHEGPQPIDPPQSMD
jgi:hypothetical protein